MIDLDKGNNMYQAIEKEATEKDFNEVMDVFNEQFKSIHDDIKEDDSEWDMSAEYATNYACIWNLVENVGKQCTIVAKNGKMAIVSFNGEGISLQENIYRLEDLTVTF